MIKITALHTLTLVSITLLACSCAKTINGCKIEPATDCRGAILVGADMRNAELSAADLAGADLTRADLRGANLNWANLREANLRGTNLSGAILNAADFNLRGAKYDGQTQWPEEFDLAASGAVLVEEDD